MAAASEDDNKTKISWTFRASVIAACLNGVAVGNLAGWPMAATPQLLKGDWRLSETEVAWISGIFFLGMLAGGFASYFLASWYGKKWLFPIASVPISLGWGLMLVAVSFTELLISRIILGLGGGMMFLQTEMYLSEINELKWRPRMSVLFCVSFHFGVLVSFVVGSELSLRMAPAQVYLPIVLFLVLLYLLVAPETPYWLVRKGRIDEALGNLRKLRGYPDVHQEFRDIVEFVEETQCVASNKSGYWRGLAKLLGERANRRGLFLVIVMTTAQQFSGMTAMYSYAGLIFERYMQSSRLLNVGTLMGTIELGCTLGSGYLVGLMRRRTLTILSTSLCSGSMALMGLHFYQLKEVYDDSPLEEASGDLIIVCVVVMSLAYGLGLATLPTVIASECLSIDARSLGAAVQNTVLCVSMFTITHFWMLITLLLGTEWAFFTSAAITGLHCILLLTILPETSGKSLMEIQRLLGKSSTPSILERFGNGKVHNDIHQELQPV